MADDGGELRSRVAIIAQIYDVDSDLAGLLMTTVARMARYADDAFDLGEDRFPFGAKEVPLAERVEQARRLVAILKSS